MQKTTWVLFFITAVLMSVAAVSCTGLVLPHVPNSEAGQGISALPERGGAEASLSREVWAEQEVPRLQEANCWWRLHLGVRRRGRRACAGNMSAVFFACPFVLMNVCVCVNICNDMNRTPAAATVRSNIMRLRKAREDV